MLAFVVLLFSAVVSEMRPLPLQAKGPRPENWSQFTNISNSPTMSLFPTIATDRAGRVHVLWAEDIDGPARSSTEQFRNGGNAIMYSVWDGVRWSSPIDIWYSPTNETVGHSSAAVDSTGMLHVVWTGTGRLYYSRAPTGEAALASRWSPARELARNLAPSVYQAAIVVDRNDVIHVIYPESGESSGIYHISSNDGGIWWSYPTLIFSFLPGARGLVAGCLSLGVDGRNRLHATWNLWDRDGDGQAVYYTRSLDAGKTWAEARVLDEKRPEDYSVAWPNLGYIGNDEVHALWQSGERAWRFHAWSQDGGDTWSEPRRILNDLVGETGVPQMVTDNNGVLHLVTQMRGERTDGSDYDYRASGIRYTQWNGDDWIPPYLVPGPSDNPRRYGGLYIRMAISLGNRLVIAWEDEGMGEILFTSAIVDAPGLAPVEYARPTATTLVPVTSPSPISTPIATAIRPTPQLVSLSGAVAPAFPTWVPWLLGVSVSFLLVIVVVAAYVSAYGRLSR